MAGLPTKSLLQMPQPMLEALDQAPGATGAGI